MMGVVVGVVVGNDSLALTLLPGICLAAGIGAVEDVRGVRILVRLLLTASAGMLLLWAIFNHGLPPGVAGTLTLVVAVPWTLALVNAVNFMDGINGISAATAVVCGMTYALLGQAADSAGLTVLGGVVAASAIGFLPYNVPRARVFLGDVGSYGLGAAMAAMSLLAVADGLPVEAAVAPVALYLADTATTIVRRVVAGESLRLPHKQHVYQQLVQLNWSHLTVSSLVAVLTAACAALGAVSVVGSSGVRIAADLGILVIVVGYLGLPRLPAARLGVR